MKSRNSDWLMEMMNAALEDSREDLSAPEITALIENAQSRNLEKSHIEKKSSWLVPVAAVVITALIAAPVGFFTGKRIIEKQISISLSTNFVEELISGSLFDDGLLESEEWFSEINIDENFFDI